MSQATTYIAYWHNSFPVETEFETLSEAERFMRSQGFAPSGQFASDAITDGGRILWDGYCDFWVEEGRSLDSYQEGFEPRIRILHREASDDED